MTAYHYRADGEAIKTDSLGSQTAPFLFVFVLSGEVEVREGDKTSVLRALDSWTRYGAGDGIEWAFSHTAEVFVLEGDEAAAKDYGSPDTGGTVITRESEDAYIVGDGPRAFFGYRDLGTAGLTDRRIHIHLVRAVKMSEGGTGWHSHTMGQIFYILRGQGKLLVEDAAAVKMDAGDAMCIAPGMRHNVPGFSKDYFLLEMCVPADYDTVDAPPPAIWATE
ncbi:Mannose-6-phosphate isomerase, cupin superfamily [Sphingobium faniae]|nr:Mannose-6-phosphate isomerase, cupin superfamily [Sphingobium faniae]